MSNVLLPQVKLPFKTIKGNINTRQDKSTQLVNKFYREIKGRFKNGEIKLNEIQKCINEVLPQKVNVQVKNLVTDIENSDMVGGSDLKYNKDYSKILSITIDLPTVENKIPIQQLPTLMHEFTHVADQLYNPKIISRSQYMTDKDLYIKEYDDLYDSFVYNCEEPESNKEKVFILKRLEQVFKGFLKKLDPKDKINYLQDSRYCTMLEMNGYKSQRKFAKQLAKQHIRVDEDDLLNENKNYMFPEKLELLNKLMKDVINKERAKHKANINRIERKKLNNKNKAVQP